MQAGRDGSDGASLAVVYLTFFSLRTRDVQDVDGLDGVVDRHFLRPTYQSERIFHALDYAAGFEQH